MIVVRLKGGLGNQMFQYAAGRSLALRRGVSLRLDTSGFHSDPKRSYQLNHLRIVASPASANEVFRSTGRPQTRWHNWIVRFDRLLKRTGRVTALPRLDLQGTLGIRPRIYQEPHFQYDPSFHQLPDEIYLDGYWQSARYFSDISEKIRHELSVKEPKPAPVSEMALRIENKLSVSVHVRRGDYVHEHTTATYHGTCSTDYYRAAAARLRTEVHDPHFFVFSDDLSWVQENLGFCTPRTLVDLDDEVGDHHEIELMSLCTHHIIANSSFSWWGAWLDPTPDAIVIAPGTWFRESSINTEDLLPAHWIPLNTPLD